MTTPITSRRQAEDLLLKKAADDQAFRRQLVSNPNAAINSAFGVTLPQDVKITVLEESARQVYLVLPAKEGSGELAEEELVGVAGGAELKEASDSGKAAQLFGISGTRAREAAE